MCGSSPRIFAAAWVDSSASRVCRARHHRTATSGEMNRYARRLHYPQLHIAAGDTHFYYQSAARMGAVITPRTSRRPRASSPRLPIMLIIAHQATSLRHKSVARLPASVVGLFNCPNCAPVIRRQPLPAGTDTASYAPSYTGYKQP